VDKNAGTYLVLFRMMHQKRKGDKYSGLFEKDNLESGAQAKSKSNEKNSSPGTRPGELFHHIMLTSIAIRSHIPSFQIQSHPQVPGGRGIPS
jgi:hypothetical protein